MTSNKLKHLMSKKSNAVLEKAIMKYSLKALSFVYMNAFHINTFHINTFHINTFYMNYLKKNEEKQEKINKIISSKAFINLLIIHQIYKFDFSTVYKNGYKPIMQTYHRA